jgi:4-amino-4-deoxy-L-arabinose transferase-like glycosyltransferase
MNYEQTRWFCPVPPGWPLVLAIGAFFGVPWLVNPILGGVNMLLAYCLIGGLYDRRTARIAVVLLATSPWQVFLAMSFMTHTLTTTFALLAAVAVLWARRTGRFVWGLVGGLATGGVGLVRPLEGFTWAVLLGLWIIGLGGRRLKFTTIAAFVVGGAAVTAGTLYYNLLLTGDPTVFPIMAYTDKYYGKNSNALGFGADRGFGWALDPYPGHSPRDAVINANLNTFSINIELFGWSTGSLVLMALFLFAGRPRGPDWLMLAVIAAVFGVHFFYYYSGGPDFGARYWYLMLIPLVVLSVRGLEVLTGLLARDGARATIAVLALCALSVVNYFPWRAADKYHHFEDMRPDIRELAERHKFGRSLVLIRGDRHPDYASAAIYNPLDLYADAPIYAWDRSPEVRTQVLDVYRDRAIWIVEGPTVTGNGFRVVAGPLQAREVIATNGK